MYTILLKDNGPDLDLIITRALVALAAIAALVYHPPENNYLHFVSAAILFIAAVFIKILRNKFKVNKLVILACAAVILFIATRSISFAIILLLNGYLTKFLYKNLKIDISEKGVVIKKLFISPNHQWNEFSNIILKDGLLTLDFKNNKLIQVEIDQTNVRLDENIFNEFCKRFI